jgi:hypothetical protein
VTAREYIEAIAAELSRVRGCGLLLSSADVQLALSWHDAGVPLCDVLFEIRRAQRLKAPKVRGAAQLGLSLQLIAEAIASRVRRKPKTPPAVTSLEAELVRAARAPRLAARAAWEALAHKAEDLLAAGGDAYWADALRALRAALRELPRQAALQVGSDLRSRMAPRPSVMPRALYRRSLQLQLLAAASERLGVPPRAFLL